VNHSFIDTKCSVILAITNFAKNSPKEFIPYIKEVFVHFEGLWDYIHDNVNIELILAYQSLLESIFEAEKGENVQSQESLAKKICVSEVFPRYESIIENSDIKEEVVKVLEAIYNIIDYFGFEIFLSNNLLERIMKICETLLEFKACCQLKGDEEDEEDIDHDEQILGGVVDLFLILSEKLKNEFHPYLTKYFTCFKKYLSPARTESDRSMIFGCMADVLKYSTISVKFFIDIIFQTIEENLKKNLKKKHDELYRHIAYLIGILFEADPESSKKYLEQSLKYLQGIFDNSKKNGKENVIASLCRIALALRLSLQSQDSQEQVVFATITETILSNIPLKSDIKENSTIFKFIQYLGTQGSDSLYKILGSYFQPILDTIKTLVVNDVKCETPKETIKEIKIYLEGLSNFDEGIKMQIETYVSLLPEIDREKFLNSIRNV
jgi:hypothetical protein